MDDFKEAFHLVHNACIEALKNSDPVQVGEVTVEYGGVKLTMKRVEAEKEE